MLHWPPQWHGPRKWLRVPDSAQPSAPVCPESSPWSSGLTLLLGVGLPDTAQDNSVLRTVGTPAGDLDPEQPVPREAPGRCPNLWA